MDSVNIQTSGNTTTVVFDAAIGIRDTRTLHEQLGKILTQSEDILLDGSHIERLDAAAMQVLIAFSRAAQNQGRTITWYSPSTALLQAAQVMGIESMFETTS